MADEQNVEDGSDLSWQPQPAPGRVIIVTGAMAAGKSTVAELLAERLERSVHVRGDVFRRMVVKGRAEMTPDPSVEAIRQLRLRYELAAATSDRYAAAGFDVVVQDVILGRHLRDFLAMIKTRPRHLVVLRPSLDALAERERARAKSGYLDFSPEQLDRELRIGGRPGLWIDSSQQTPDQTVEMIWSRLAEAAV